MVPCARACVRDTGCRSRATTGNVYQAPWAAYLPESPSVWDSMHHQMPPWAVYRSDNYGYTRMHANATHLHVQYIALPRGAVHDEFTLQK